MYAKILAAACAAALLGGCAGGTGGTRPAADHPANPRAASAPLPPVSTTLSIASTQPSQRAADANGAQSHSHHQPPATAPATRDAVVYVCPHHPEVTSTDPNARCPKCHMKLVRKAAPAGEGQ
jgi:hypothetical protein